ncbi:hypothetical protein [Leptospira dzoumogneensis]|uniref:Uncharacterized protein n=1 Tax=Leptospira dzoumogneensis TaxID=2484904 RepID=A0A4Z1AFT7_9LEPT|nr:hypothetical protein [Leptospira dzoumogneensis]TGN02988.1 hypothetical protein EHR06_02985 [Leptospira dzoumogneensis]
MVQYEVDPEIKKQVAAQQRLLRVKFWLEILFWLILNILSFTYAERLLVNFGYTSNYLTLVKWTTNIAVLFFPLFSFFTFANPPFAALGDQIQSLLKGGKSIYKAIGNDFVTLDVKYKDSLLYNVAKESKYLSEWIFKRAGAYLWGGMSISIFGLLFLIFSAQDIYILGILRLRR